MRPTVEAALKRIIEDETYRAAVIGWINAHETVDDERRVWTGKSDAAGSPVMNICSGGPPITVAIETILYVIENRVLPDDEAPLVFRPSSAARVSRS